ncbi:hypothetical protein [Chishuiella sp.]|uniref:hypothetical protein n=1 Tax=Chishuiella sp. TaxID=1969467 RepID=UPI0028AC25FB|nr:hypothetical protein [Chishuiella sp.]
MYTKIDYYNGYIYEKKSKPTAGLTIKGDLADVSTKTDKIVYFKINNLDLLNFFIYVYNQYKLLDYIQIIRTHSERGIKYYFVNGRNDTIFLKTRIYN